MHGTYRVGEFDDFRVYTSVSDVEALVASFPKYSYQSANLQDRWISYGLKVSVCALLLGVGGATHDQLAPDVEPSHTDAVGEVSAAPDKLAAAKPSPPMLQADVTIQSESEVEPTDTKKTSAPTAFPKNSVEVTKVSSMPEKDGRIEAVGVESSEPMDTTAEDEPFLLEEESELPVSSTPLSVNQGGKTHLTTIVDGKAAGALEFSDANQTIAVRLGSLLDLLKDRFPPDQFESMARSPAADAFVPIERLSDAGIPIAYDAVYDELEISTSTAGNRLS